MDRLEAQAIEPGAFGHREHLEAAFEALKRDEFLTAATRYATAIRRFAAAAGAADKFSMTITLAYLSLLAEKMARKEYDGFDAFLEANRDLLDNPLAASYSPSRLSAPLARTIFLLPDRAGERFAKQDTRPPLCDEAW